MNTPGQKSLQQLAGRPFLKHILEAVAPICSTPTIVVGHRADEVKAALGSGYHYVFQEQQLGTGHAVLVTKETLEQTAAKQVIVLYGDSPFVSTTTIQLLLDGHRAAAAVVTLATVTVPNFSGSYEPFLHFGRIIRTTEGDVERIVEYRDATAEERLGTEVNPAFYCFDATWLWKNIVQLSNDNAAGEYYLTELIHRACSEGAAVHAVAIDDAMEGLGINTPAHLAIASAYHREREK